VGVAPVLLVKGLSFAYAGNGAALKGVGFSIAPGERVALLGANGAGKSTLLWCLVGILAGRGKIEVAGTALAANTKAEVRKNLVLAFSEPDDQLFMPTVFEDVAFGPMNLGLESDDLEHKVMQALETVGAAHLKSRPPYRLSHGEKRSVAIATVLAMSPDILVMDEPTSSLDPMSRARLIELLKTFHHTKIIATHDLDMAMDLCERAIVLHQGRITGDGPIMKLLQDEELLHRSRLERPLRMQGCPICGSSSN